MTVKLFLQAGVGRQSHEEASQGSISSPGEPSAVPEPGSPPDWYIHPALAASRAESCW